jgi:hypothetical protein
MKYIMISSKDEIIEYFKGNRADDSKSECDDFKKIVQ